MAPSTGNTQLPSNLHADHSYKLVITTCVSFALATFGIVGRFIARFICRKRLELNDYLILAGYIMKLGLTILSSLLIYYGIGRHIQTLTASQIQSYLIGTWTGSFWYAPTITLIKLSILSLYYSAFPSRYMRVSVWIVSSIVIAWGVALCLVGLLACIPIHKSWQPETPGTCIDTHAYYFGLQIPNIITDFIIVFLPFRAIYHLDLTRTQLFQIGGVLSLGLVTCAIDIVRLDVFIMLPQVADITWVDLAPSMWLDLEASIAILCACLPVMRPLLHPRRFWRNNRLVIASPGDGTYEMVTEGNVGSSKQPLAKSQHRDRNSGSTVQSAGYTPA